MAGKKQIGATLVLKDSNFKSNLKSAVSQLGTFKKNTESATSSLKKMDSQSNTVGQSLGGLVKKVAGVAAAYVGFSQAKDFLTDCVTGVMELGRANTRLETLMMNVSGTTKAQVQDLIEYGDALELCTTIEGDATMAGASQLATFQLSADTIKTLLPAFQDLAVAQYGVNVSQEQMINSGNLIGKVMNGSVGALTKAGVSFTAAQEKILKTGTESEKAAALVEVLGKNFGGLAQKMAQTDEGRIRQLKNAWGSVKDEVGFAVLPAVSSLVQYLSSNIPNIRDKVTSTIETIKPIVASLWDKIKNGAKVAGDTISWVIDNWDALSPVIYGVVGAVAAYNTITGIKNGLTAISVATTGLEAGAFSGLTIAQLASVAATGALTAAQTALNAVFIASPIGWIVLAIGAVVAAIVILYKKCDTFRNFVNQLFGKIVSGAKAAFAGLKNVWNGIVTSLKPVIAAVSNAFQQAWEVIKIVWGFVQPYFQMVWNNIKAVFSVVKVYIGGMFKTAWEVVKAVWNGVTGYFTAVWNTIAGIFSVVKNVLTGNWSGAWEAIKGIVNTWSQYFASIWGSIKSVFAAVGSWFGNTFSAAWEAIKSIFSNVTGFFQNIWNTIKNMFTSIGTSIANGISGAFKSVINGVIKYAGNLINGFIRNINSAISFINKYIPGASITKLNTINLPMLWKGGTIEKPGNVIVGERGPEMLSLPKGARVTPLDKANNTTTIEAPMTFNFYGYSGDEEMAERVVSAFVPKLKLALSNL